MHSVTVYIFYHSINDLLYCVWPELMHSVTVYIFSLHFAAQIIIIMVAILKIKDLMDMY